MKAGHQYRTIILELQSELLAAIATIYATIGPARILFEEPWNIGAALDDTGCFEASGLDQRNQRVVVVDARQGGDYDLEKMPVEDLAWILITLEAGRFRRITVN